MATARPVLRSSANGWKQDGCNTLSRNDFPSNASPTRMRSWSAARRSAMSCSISIETRSSGGAGTRDGLNQQPGRRTLPVNVIYTTSAIASGGRDGHAATTDGSLDVKLARPKELGGKGGGNNPEHLFAAGYAPCFLTSLQFVASQGGPKVPANSEVQATVGLGPRSEGGVGP